MTATVSGDTGPVAFIGLGMMGRPMAARLVAAGFDVRGVDVNAEARQALAAAGARVFEKARTAVAGCDIVVTMLPDGEVVRDVLMGAGGVAGCLKEGTLVVDMSSSAPMGTRLLGAGLLEKGIALVDAPVSGGVA
ncbi:MAG: NAD(P)-binding domain-containing protein, partial [Nitratireductor sp.]